MMMARSRSFVIPVVFLLAALIGQRTATPESNAGSSEACRRHLMRVDHLRQLYAGGAGMRLRVPAVAEVVESLTAARVYEAAQRKLSANGLHDPDATQWLDVKVDVGGTQYTMILSLRRWTEDLGYGLPGEMTVWGFGGGDYHEGSADRVIARVLQRKDDFMTLYVQAQWTCGE